MSNLKKRCFEQTSKQITEETKKLLENIPKECIREYYDEIFEIYGSKNAINILSNYGSKKQSMKMQQLIKIMTTDKYTNNNKQTQIENSMTLPLSYLNMDKNQITRNKRYNQLEESIIKSDKSGWYCFGHSFEYGYVGENGGGILINKKYNSFKEELTQNNMSTVSIEQFDCEYKKSKNKLQSLYCRQYFQDYIDDNGIHWIFTVDDIIAILMYCNYDVLQYEFSRTYRSNNGQHHNEFFHFGQFMKKIIHHFGKPINNMTLYHGVNQRILFPQYIHDIVDGLCIQCPLSTSSCFDIALNFAQNNNGLILQFADRTCTTKFISVAWLSNFPNEQEYITIQNYSYLAGFLEINDITDARFGCKYGCILTALKIIQDIITAYRYQSKNVNTDMKHLVNQIFEYQLNSNNNIFAQQQTPKEVVEYAKKYY
eukprot:66734_1